MKLIQALIINLLLLTNSYAKTNWEIYIENPKDKENAKKVNSTTYANSGMNFKVDYIDKDIQIFAKRLQSLDRTAIEVMMQILNNKSEKFYFYSKPYLIGELSRVIKKAPEIYISSLKKVGTKDCLALHAIREEFVYKNIMMAEEYVLRKKALESLPKSKQSSLCIQELKGAEANLKRLIVLEANSIIDLGEINSSKKFKVYKNKQIAFISKKELRLALPNTDEDTKRFIMRLNKNNLSFKSIEQEKDYTIEFFKNKLYFKKNLEKEQIFNLEMFFNDGEISFKDKNNKAFGFINRSRYEKDKYKFKMRLKLGSDIFETNLSIGERNE